MKHFNATHGMSKTLTYNVWVKMKGRCQDPGNNRYRYYGGRGIRVCERWDESFINFLQDVGERPLGPTRFTLDRIDQNGHYEPGNVRWATYSEQARNYGRNIMLSLNGVTQCLSDWAEEYKIPRGRLRDRIVKLGWPLQDALNTSKRR